MTIDSSTTKVWYWHQRNCTTRTLFRIRTRRVRRIWWRRTQTLSSLIQVNLSSQSWLWCRWCLVWLWWALDTKRYCALRMSQCICLTWNGRWCYLFHKKRTVCKNFTKPISWLKLQICSLLRTWSWLINKYSSTTVTTVSEKREKREVKKGTKKTNDNHLTQSYDCFKKTKKSIIYTRLSLW